MTSLQFDSGTSDLIDAGETLITAVGLPNPRTYLNDDVKIVGIDATTGALRWSTPTDIGVDTCAATPIGQEIICVDPYSDPPAFLALDVRDGATRRIPVPAEWFPYAIATDGTSLFVLEGNPEDSASVLHGGNVDSLAEAWSLPVTSFALYEDLEGTMIQVDAGRGAVTLGGEITFFDPVTGKSVDGLELRSETTVIDTTTGDEVWRLDGPPGTETTIGDTVYTLTDSSVVASGAGTGGEQWEWALPTDSDGFPAYGSIVEAGTGVYFVSPQSIVCLAAP